MKTKKTYRLLSALLTILMVVAICPMFALSASVDPFATSLHGAQLRLDKAGLRFVAEFDVAKHLENANSNQVEFGFLILPTKAIGEPYNEALIYENETVLKISTTDVNHLLEAGDPRLNGITVQNEGGKILMAVMTQIPDAVLKSSTEFTVQPFVAYLDKANNVVRYIAEETNVQKFSGSYCANTLCQDPTVSNDVKKLVCGAFDGAQDFMYTWNNQSDSLETLGASKFNSGALKVTGRDTVSMTGATMNSSASTLEFNVVLNTVSDVRVTTTSGNNIWFTVYVDGVRQAKRVNFTSSAKTQTVAQNLSAGTHTIRLVRQTEAGKGAFTVTGFEFAGTFGAKPANKDLYIEFIGDSITCGTGNLHGYLNASDLTAILPSKIGACVGASGDNNPTAEQDASRSYAFLTAEELGADASLVCETGIPLVKGWWNGCPLIRDYYKKNTNGSAFDFANARKPDVVVINIGTNDAMCGADATTFKQAVKDFIAEIRTYYNDPDLKIVWVAGMMNQSMQSSAQSAINELNDANVFMKLDLPANREGHNAHPLYPTHESAAQALATFIKTTVLADN